jgi:GH24 family phage-related lysozyme (muramidase)
MTEQFDEGVKEILLSLLSLTATVYETDYLVGFLKDRPEPIEQKIDAIQRADSIINSPSFDKAAGEVLNKLEDTPPRKAAKTKPAEDRPPDASQAKSDSQIKALASELIKPSEIYGTNISHPKNKKFLVPYADDVGMYTIGIGHKIGDGSQTAKNEWVKKHGHSITPQFAENLFDKQLDYHLNRVKEIFGAAFNDLSDNQAAVVVDISYRGDLLPEMDWVDLLQQGKNIEAANEYLDHKEYKKRKKGGSDGVVKRMERNANILASRA